MTRQWKQVICVAAATMLMGTAAMAGNGHRGGAGSNAGQRETVAAPLGELTEAESQSLIFMREEEKLARDVYRALGTQWGTAVLARIAESESRHMAAVEKLMERYAVSYTDVGDDAGAFANADLAALYEAMLAEGLQSEAAALRVGAAIEDRDLHDLRVLLETATNADVIRMLGHLADGSARHLRAFVNQLALIGETYEAQYLSAEELEEILADDAMPGRGKGQGINGGTGECQIQASADMTLLAGNGRGGSGGGGGNGGGNKGQGNGPGDGTGNGGQGPKDGTGNGPKTGGCVNNAVAS